MQEQCSTVSSCLSSIDAGAELHCVLMILLSIDAMSMIAIDFFFPSCRRNAGIAIGFLVYLLLLVDLHEIDFFLSTSLILC